MELSIYELSKEHLSTFPEFDLHHKVIEFREQNSGLHGFIAIHKKRGKLSTGGTRFYPYHNDEDALQDALRLSAAMTSKCVVSGLPYGGAKGVIIGDPTTIKHTDLLVAYAAVVESLHGEFRTGEDVGMTEADVQLMMQHAQYFNGKSDVAGDPSPFASQSVYVVAKQALSLVMNTETFAGKTIAIKGLGKVGGRLAELLLEGGATVIGADINPTVTETLRGRFPNLRIATVEEIPYLECDIYAPCALGGEVTKDNIDRFKTKIICGGANNQLEDTSLAEHLEKRGILYVPDYLANAGGLINVSDELEDDGYHHDRVNQRINNLAQILSQCYRTAQSTAITLEKSVANYVSMNL